jgi:hypothetical protein
MRYEHDGAQASGFDLAVDFRRDPVKPMANSQEPADGCRQADQRETGVSAVPKPPVEDLPVMCGYEL